MKDDQLIGLLNPLIALIFATTFLVFWLRDKQRLYILAIAISYLTMGAGFFIAFFAYSADVVMVSAVSNFCYTAATVMLVWALAVRANTNPPTVLLCSIAALSVPLNTWLKITSDNINASVYAINFCIGIMFAIGAWMLKDKAREGGVERWVYIAILLVAFQFWVRPIISLSIETNIQPLEYRQSSYWVALNFTSALFSIFIALVLIAACARDVLVDAIKDTGIDLLSGLKVRRVFDASGRDMIAKLKRTPLPLSMVLLDIDNFKRINDELGHPCGDEVISIFGKLLKDNCRESDLIGRVGGEEFCFLLWNADQPSAKAFAEELRLKISGMSINCLPREVKTTASFGVVGHQPNETLDQLYVRADKALYLAKKNGRNCVKAA